MSADLEKGASSEATFIGFLRRQFTKYKPLPAGTTIAGETAIVTGSNIGLGLSACRQLLELGLSHLVMAVRTQAKGDDAALQLRKDFPSSTIDVWVVDMGSYDSVRAFATRCESLPRLDIVILNAGVLNEVYRVSPAGNEMTLQVNYLSTVLLTMLLLPILKAKKAKDATRPPTISVVASDTIYKSMVDLHSPVLPQFQQPKKYSAFHWYARSKLLQTFFIAKLAEFVPPEDVLINQANPGATSGTDFFRGYPSYVLKTIVSIIQKMVARPVDLAATTYLDAVLAQGKGSHGSFTSDWTIKPLVVPVA
ncbi:hypothetical protein QQS21_004207 [Conoideocrella luteorostrata]|uniref:Short-chain dehydrogenase/reductase family protein n=1 Tax=Conoideocrella luteorostrata TaxID=1105319 RepID=A0AAJ0G012_9HYPO|nr:hypothetical protein QQS21_004207 [Conoideocrella luteorostrata]